MKEITQVIEGSSFPQVIILTGDDYMGREKAKEKIKTTLQQRHGEISEEHYDSTRESFTLFTERMLTHSLFQTVRLFQIRHAQNLSEKDIPHLELALSNPMQDVFILLETEQKSEKKKDVLEKLDLKKREKKEPGRFAILEFSRPPDYKMVQWLMTQVPLLFSREITKGGADTLIEYVGYELDRLYSELVKLDIHLPDKAAIDKQTVEHVIGATREMTVFELSKALAQKDLTRALTIVNSLFSDSFSAPACIGAIFHHFWKIYKIRAFATMHRDQANAFFKTAYQAQMKVAFDIGVATGILKPDDTEKKAYPVMILSGLIEQARSFQYEHLKQILHWLRDFDVGVKTGRVKPTRQNIEQLCYSIVRVAEILPRENAA